MKAVLIDFDSTVRVEEKGEGEETGDWLRRLVGGWIEGFPTPFGSCDGWLNEEGKLENLPRNDLATAILRKENLLFDGDYIAGPFVITGPCDADGDTQGLSGDQLRSIRDDLAADLHFVDERFDCRVERIEAQAGFDGKPTKANLNGGVRWLVPVTYTLRDGRVIDSNQTHRLQRDAKAYVAKLPMVPEHPTRLLLDQNGKMRAVQVTLSLRMGVLR